MGRSIERFRVHKLLFLLLQRLVALNCLCPIIEKSHPIYYQEFPNAWRSNNLTSWSFDKSSYSRRDTKNNVKMVNSYQSDFDGRYPPGSNYSEIFRETAKASRLADGLKFVEPLNYSFASFPSLYEVYEYLTVLEKLSEDRAIVIPLREYDANWNIIRTNFGNKILSVRISSKPPKSHEQNPIIIVVAGRIGIHGRDWYAVQSAIFLATKLIFDADRKSSQDFDWWIVPILNPDGYQLSRTEPKRRNWKKNIFGTERIDSNECFGVDLDLNFEYQWLPCNVTSCDSNFPGDVPFSTPEARGLRDTLEAYSDYIDTFVALKEGKECLVYPFSDTLENPRYVASIEKISQRAVEAFGKHVEPTYRHGQSSHVIELTAGFIEDWGKIHLGVVKSFAFYLGPRQKDRRELVSQHLMDHMNGTFDLLNVLARGKIQENTQNGSSTNHSCLPAVFIFIVFQYLC